MYYGVFTKRCAPDGVDYLSRDGSVFVSIKVSIRAGEKNLYEIDVELVIRKIR